MFNRRTFLGLPLIFIVGESQALEVVNPNEPTAKALGYIPKTAIVGSTCANCIQARDTGNATIPCNLFPNKLVHRNGWCKVYVKRPS